MANKVELKATKVKPTETKPAEVKAEAEKPVEKNVEEKKAEEKKPEEMKTIEKKAEEVKEAAKAAAMEAVRIASEEEEEFESLKHLEDIKNYTLQLAENNIEQSILVLRGWMKDDTKTAISS